MADVDDAFKDADRAVSALLEKVQRMRLRGKNFNIYPRKAAELLGPGRSAGRPAPDDTDEG